MRLEKQAISNDIRQWLLDATFVFFADYRGLKVQTSSDLRKRLAEHQSQLHVVPNRLCRRMVDELAWGLDDPQALVGPTALISGRGDALAVAKLLKEFYEEYSLPRIKLGRFEGRYFASADIDALVKLPAKPVMQSILVGTLAGPLTHLTGVLKQKVASLVYVLKAAQDKKESAQ